MSKRDQRSEQQEPEVFRQAPDPTGRIRLDRRFTPEEAAEQDERHRQMYLEGQRQRFRPQAT